MTRRSKNILTKAIDPPEVILTEVQEWALTVLNDPAPRVSLDDTIILFTDMCPESVPEAMITTLLEVAQSVQDIRRATFFMRRFQDELFTRAIDKRKGLFSSPVERAKVKMNAMPEGNYNPRLV